MGWLSKFQGDAHLGLWGGADRIDLRLKDFDNHPIFKTAYLVVITRFKSNLVHLDFPTGTELGKNYIQNKFLD